MACRESLPAARAEITKGEMEKEPQNTNAKNLECSAPPTIQVEELELHESSADVAAAICERATPTEEATDDVGCSRM